MLIGALGIKWLHQDASIRAFPAPAYAGTARIWHRNQIMNKIEKISALEILDSRGNPTVSVTVTLANGLTASAGVLSGLQPESGRRSNCVTATRSRMEGKGVLKAVENVNRQIAPKLKGKSPHAQKEIDDLMRELDGTETKSKLGAKAFPWCLRGCRATAQDAALPL
jgi:enolase